MLSQLNQRAALQAQVLNPDGGGGFTAAWQTLALIWVKITPVSARDAFGPDAVESRIRHRISLRRRDDVAAGQRLVVGNRSFRIHAVLDAEPHAALINLLCEELP